MGALGWVTATAPLQSVTIWVGGGHPGQASYGLTFDRMNEKFHQDFLLSVGNADLEIGKIVQEVFEFSSFFETWLKEKGFLGESEIGCSMMRFGVEFK